jgi:superfamily II DNA or RNA helicase
MSNQEDRRDELSQERALLARLEQEVAQARDRIRALEASVGGEANARNVPDTAPAKVALFRSLFRGREDVFPRHWQNAKTGRKGYALACANEWVRGVCEKPRVKCGECPNQAFVPVSDQAILDHLQGRHVIGVYPILDDDRCWFLAADFDKESWVDDVAAFVDTCRGVGLPVAVERSRSGNGAHVWFFFAGPVAAASARRMACYLITETMSRRHQLSLESYDRLFPNQDTLPRGGFGNLIALPLQYEARRRGNTVFVDGRLSPFPDQWAFLAGLAPIQPATVDTIAEEGSRRGRVVGLSISPTGEDDGDAPWTVRPSRRQQALAFVDPVPCEVRAVLAQRLFVEKARLPSALLNQIKRLAAFQNPEFYQRQKARLSTALTPRVIGCAEELAQHMALPRGCLEDLESLLHTHGATLRLEDERVEGKRIDIAFKGRLTTVQEDIAQRLLAHDTGVLVTPPGTGKTVVGTYLVAARCRSTLVLVHRNPLLEQWVAQLSTFLGVDAKAIGRIGGGKRRPTGWVDVATIQSLVRDGVVDDIVATYGYVLVDECHHLPAVSFERVLAEVKPRYVTGLTATPYRRDGHQPIIHMQCGPIRHVVDPRSQAAQRPFGHRLVCRETPFRADGDESPGIQRLYARLVTDVARNEVILNDIISAVDAGRSPLVLTERKDHLDFLAGKLRKFARHVVVLQGGGKAKARREALEQLAAIPEDEERLVLATGRYAGEGFDDARLDTLFLAMPIAWRGTLIQYAGRLHRLHPGKREVVIYDYVDREVPVLAKMFEKRQRGYRALGYEVSEDGGFPQPAAASARSTARGSRRMTSR